MITKTKIGEVQMKMVEDVQTTEELNVLLRINWGAETTSRITVKPASDLGVGDGLKVTLEKLVETKEELKPAEETAPAEGVVGAERMAAEAAGEQAPSFQTELAASEPAPATESAGPAAEEKKEEEPPVDFIGEAKGRMVTEVTQENNPRVLLRIVYRNKSDEVPLTLAEELKSGEEIQVTIIRTFKAPEAEPAEDAVAAQG